MKNAVGAEGDSELTRATELVRDGEAELARRDYPAAQHSFDQASIVLRRILGDNDNTIIAEVKIGLGRAIAASAEDF